MTEVNSADSYYQYRAESDNKIKAMTAEIAKLKNEIRSSNLAAAIDRLEPDPEVSNLIFKLVSDQVSESDQGISIGDKTLTQAIDSIRSNEGLRNFFSGADIPVPAPQREFKQWFE
jgi:5,10-methylene-tetrahydrofolate dehydrogenase/methenyl tetrahydrofolate cyclohydrolase